MSTANSSARSLNHLRPSLLYSGLLLSIALSVVTIWALIGSEFTVARDLSRKYDEYFAQDKHGSEPFPDYDEHWSSPDWGVRDPEVSMFFWRSFALLIDTVHLPIHLIFFLKNKMRPAVALSTSIVMMLIWAGSAANTIVLSVSSYKPSDRSRQLVTFRLAAANLAFQCLIVLLYFIYMCFCARAVHEKRKSKSVVKSRDGDAEMK